METSLKLNIERTYDTTVEILFEACSKMVFFRPSDRNLPLNFYVGGHFHFTTSKGETIKGKFVEIVVPKKIVFTWESTSCGGPTGETLVTITIEKSGSGSSRLNLVHEGLPNEHSREEHQNGWKIILEHLEMRKA